MIRGIVSPNREPVVRLRVRGPTGLTADVDVVVDTGFDGQLVLPAVVLASVGVTWGTRGTATLAGGSTQRANYYDLEIEWGTGWVKAVAMTLGAETLLGMELLDGKKLTVEGSPGGAVEITPWP
jgi:predicted aspartyl protease